MSHQHNERAVTATAINDARAQWELRAYRRIEYVPGTEYSRQEIVRRNEYITAAYAEMYLRRPNVFTWAGMAALTSAAVGRGMYLMQLLRASRLGFLLGLFPNEVATVEQMLGVGNLAVFTDIYWQHMAYDAGGRAALQRIYEAGRLNQQAWEAWQQIDQGKRTNDQALIWAGNAGLLYFEQKEVLQPAVYDQHLPIWQVVSAWINSPILGHYESITSFLQGANLGDFQTRWQWIEQSMLPRWKRLAQLRAERVERELHTLLIGGAPFSIPGIPVAKLLGQGMYKPLRTSTLGRKPATWS
ncbi:MAG: hypothetical protein M3R24_30320 [Chloroflexota bacterium]|nr:hypothetical protein [Chloroflexota bacterium]